MVGRKKKNSLSEQLKKDIQRTLVEARNALYRGERETARHLAEELARRAAPVMWSKYRQGEYQTLLEALSYLEKELLPEDEVEGSGPIDPKNLPSVELIPAQPQDRYLMAEVCRSVTELYDEFMPGAFQRQAQLFELEGLGSYYRTFIINHLGKGVGFLGYKLLSIPSTVFLVALLVHYDHQREGIGSSALEVFQKEIAENHTTVPLEEIVLLVHRRAEWAIRFYLKHGFALITDREREIKKYRGGLLQEECLPNTWLMSKQVE